MILEGRKVSGGKAEGYALGIKDRISFLGDVDPSTGKLNKDGSKITDKILVFPGGRGSTVGSYVIYQLKKNGTGPLAMVNQLSETIVATGAIISDIPLVDGIDIDIISSGDQLIVDGDKGTIEIKNVKSKPVVTVFLRKNNEILMLKRSEEVGSYRGKWSAVSGYLEDAEPSKQAHTELLEETGLRGKLVNQGGLIRVRYADVIWEIHPFLMDLDSDKDIELNWENTEYMWIPPEKIKELNTVPKLWEVYKTIE